MRRSKYILTALAAFLVSLSASAQSKSFSLGKWVELHNAILKELNRSYVDSLEVGASSGKASMRCCRPWIPIPSMSLKKSRKTSR